VCSSDLDKLLASGLHPQLIVDCSHANSGKSHERQALVCRDLASQIAAGNRRIAGLMLESHLVAGAQKQIPGQPLTYGQSITDACMSWDVTADLLQELAEAVRARRLATAAA
jgi:3-deoxy-7-phosphoheptulonate synthase